MGQGGQQAQDSYEDILLGKQSSDLGKCSETGLTAEKASTVPDHAALWHHQ